MQIKSVLKTNIVVVYFVKYQETNRHYLFRHLTHLNFIQSIPYPLLVNVSITLPYLTFLPKLSTCDEFKHLSRTRIYFWQKKIGNFHFERKWLNPCNFCICYFNFKRQVVVSFCKCHLKAINVCNNTCLPLPISLI